MKKMCNWLMVCIWMIACPIVYAQHIPYSNVPDNVLEDPEQFSDELVFKAYQNKALSLLVTEPDQAAVVFKQRAAWARSKELTEYEGDTYAHLGELFYMQGAVDSALFYFREGVQKIEEDTGFLAMNYLRLGECLMILEQLDSAQYYNDLGAQLIFENERTDLYTMAYTYQGALANRKERFVTAIENYTQALEFAQEAHITMRKSNVHENIAGIYSNIGDIENAKKHTLASIKIAEEDGYYNTLLKQKLLLAIHENSLQNYSKAKEILEDILPKYESKKDTGSLIKIYVNMAFSYLKLDQPARCKKLLDQATRLVVIRNNSGPDFGYESVQGHYYLDQSEFSKAKTHFLKAHQKAERNGDTRMEIVALKGLMNVSIQARNTIDELAYTKLYFQKKDSLFNLNQSKIIYDHEARYQKAEQELAISKLNTQNDFQTQLLSQRKRQLLGSGVGLVILGLLTFFMFRLYRKVKSQNVIISTAHKEKSILLKEIHHRVKNNLQVVSSLLGLQTRYVEDDMALAAIKTGRARVQSMSLLHQNVYRNENLKSVNIQKYFEDLGQNLFANYRLDNKEIIFHTDIEELELDIDVVVPMGLITNELISNSLKYAFSEKNDGNIFLYIREKNGLLELKVSDDGIGVPFTELPEKSKSLGMQLVKSFSHKLKAKVDISNENGTSISIKFDPRRIVVAAA